jgi:uncharacterized coiled-coil DUF342 family protein
MGLLYTQLLERLDKVVAERDAALADAQVEKTRADELNWEFERLSKAASKKIESLEKDLAQAIAERTPHDYGILKEEAQEMRKQRDEARDKAEENHWRAKAVAGERDIAFKEVEQLKQALHDARLENSGQAAQLERKRPEPSRLEIAALIYAAFAGAQCDKEKVNPTAYVAVKCADELIAAAKEGK